MKKEGLILVILLVGFFLGFLGSVNAFSGGDGTFANPYQIANCADLNSVRVSGHYILISNIDAVAGGCNSLDSGKGIDPIGSLSSPFTGSFNGNGFTISNLQIKRSSYAHQGFMGVAKNTNIYNLTLTGLSITGSSVVGGLLSQGSNINISNVYVSGEVLGKGAVGGLIGNASGTIQIVNSSFNGNMINPSYDYQGGLVGLSRDNLTINFSSVVVNLEGNYYTGGLVGSAKGPSNVFNSQASGRVKGALKSGGIVGSADDVLFIENVSSRVELPSYNSYIGGLVGYSYQKTTIISSYYDGNIPGSTYSNEVGGLVGYSNSYNNGELMITNSYSKGTINGSSSLGGLVGRGEKLEISNSFSSMAVNGRNIVGGLVGETYSSGIVKIKSSHFNGSVFATGDDAGGLVGRTYGFSTSSISILNSFSDAPISGSSSSDKVGGLIGENTYATSNIENSYNLGSISGNNYIGGLVGYSDETVKILGSYSRGSITGSQQIGGLIGKAIADISFSYSTGNIVGKHYVGGLVGVLTSSRFSVISNSYYKGNIVVEGSMTYPAVVYAGGLVGYLAGGSIALSFAEANINSSNKGFSKTKSIPSTVTYYDNLVGGLVGYQYSSSISNCYFYGNVSGYASEATANKRANFIGGLVGKQAGTSSVSYSYAIPSIRGTGGNLSKAGLVADCYSESTCSTSLLWTKLDPTNSDFSCGTPDINTKRCTSDSGYPSLADMQVSSKYSGFDFTNIWAMGIEYPYAQFKWVVDSANEELNNLCSLPNRAYLYPIANTTLNAGSVNYTVSFPRSSAQCELFIDGEHRYYNSTLVRNLSNSNPNNTISYEGLNVGSYRAYIECGCSALRRITSNTVDFQVLSSLDNTLKWKDMEGLNIDTGRIEVGDSVFIFFGTSNLNNWKNYTIYRGSTLLAQGYTNNPYVFFGDTSVAGSYKFKMENDSSGSWKDSGVLNVLEGASDSMISSEGNGISSPLENEETIYSANYPIPFNHSFSDVDDLLNIFWDFGDNSEGVSFENFASFLKTYGGTGAGTLHSYSFPGIYKAIVFVTEMNSDVRRNSKDASVNIRIYKNGINVFPKIETPVDGAFYGNSWNTFQIGNIEIYNCTNSIASVEGETTVYSCPNGFAKKTADNLLCCGLNKTLIFQLNSEGELADNYITPNTNWSLRNYRLNITWDFGDELGVRSGYLNDTKAYFSLVNFRAKYLSSGQHVARLEVQYEEF